MKTETPGLTLTILGLLAIFWTALLILLWQAWSAESRVISYGDILPANEGYVRVRADSIMIALGMDGVMVFCFLQMIYSLSGSLELARLANLEDEGLLSAPLEPAKIEDLEKNNGLRYV
jgi:hypothetical protein